MNKKAVHFHQVNRLHARITSLLAIYLHPSMPFAVYQDTTKPI